MISPRSRIFLLRVAASLAWLVACALAVASVATAWSGDGWAVAVAGSLVLLVMLGRFGFGVIEQKWEPAGTRRAPRRRDVTRFYATGLAALAVAAGLAFLLAYGTIGRPWYYHYYYQSGPEPDVAPARAAALFAVMALVGLAFAAAALSAVRPRRAERVLGYLAWAVASDLPLPAALAAAARGERGRVGRSLDDLQDLLGRGSPVAAALAVSTPEMPARAVQLVAAGERLGQLGTTLSRLSPPADASGDPRVADADDPAVATYRFYPAIVVTIAVLVIGGYATFVLPKFLTIGRDFHVQMFVPIAWAMEWPGVPVAMGAAGIVAIGYLASSVLPPSGRRGRLRPALRAAADRVTLRLPLLGRRAWESAMADVCELLADALSAGWPLDAALAEAEGLAANASIVGRLRRWRAAARAGAAADAAAARAGLPPLMAAMLNVGGGDRGPADGLRYLAAHYRIRLGRTDASIRTAGVVAVAVVGGAVVTLLALSVFVPMRQLMDAVEPFVVRM